MLRERIGDLDVREGQRPGAAPHLVLEWPSAKAGGVLDRDEAEALRDLLEDWLR